MNVHVYEIGYGNSHALSKTHLPVIRPRDMTEV